MSSAYLAMEKVITVGIKYSNTTYTELNNSLDELSQLINTAGGEVVETVVQKRIKPDPAYLIGEGKTHEIATIAKNNKIRTVIFNDELTNTQQRNLEEIINTKIIDRTRLILDIFAYRARTKEGALQVELAQLNYYLPRLTKRGIWLDGQVGGIGTRGPGERKLEYDKRRIRDRIVILNHEINKIQQYRKLHRQKRINQNLSTISLIGYTNVGKSTLLNTITNNNQKRMLYADNKLFATLDPTLRRVKLPSGRVVLISDTVGFIRRLPHQLIAAFRATLEEIKESDCLVHVIDITSTEHKIQKSVVMQTLTEIGATNIPIISVYNKCDLLQTFGIRSRYAPRPRNTDTPMARDSNSAIYISAKTGSGVEQLLKQIDKTIGLKKVYHELCIPYKNLSLINILHKYADIVDESYDGTCLKLKLRTDSINWNKLKKKVGEYS